MGTWGWVAVVAVSVVFGLICRNAARKRGRSDWYFVLGFFTWLIGYFVIVLMGHTRAANAARHGRHVQKVDQVQYSAVDVIGKEKKA